MQEPKKRRLQAAGWRVAGSADFLDLSPEEAELVEERLKCSPAIEAKGLGEGGT